MHERRTSDIGHLHGGVECLVQKNGETILGPIIIYHKSDALR